MRDHPTTFVAGSGTPGFVPKCRETVCRCVVIGAAIACSLAAGEAAAAVTAQPPAARQEKDANLGPVKAIVDGMQNAGVRLKQGDTGTGTRTIQEKVVNDLQKLIDEAKSKSRRTPTAEIGIEPEQKFAESIRVPAEVGIGRRLGRAAGKRPAGAQIGDGKAFGLGKKTARAAAAPAASRGLGPSSARLAGARAVRFSRGDLARLRRPGAPLFRVASR